MPEQASVDVGTVRQRFNFDWAMSEPVDGIDTYWWWARSIRVDPNEVIADDDEGNLWSIPWSTDGEDAVTFGTPTRVRETFVPVTAGDGAAAAAVVDRRRQRAMQGGAALAKPTKPDPNNPAASAATTQEEPTMDVDTSLLRRRLGLSDDATDEQITEALNAEPPEPEPAAGVPEDEVEQRIEAAVAAARQEERQKASASSEDTVTFDKATAEQLQADAKAGREARDQQIGAQRDSLVAAAVEDGRIAPARRDHWRRSLDADPEGAASVLAGLEKGLIPVTERGVAAASETTNDSDQGTGWFPQLATKED